jgi:hypothetical protein
MPWHVIVARVGCRPLTRRSSTFERLCDNDSLASFGSRLLGPGADLANESFRRAASASWLVLARVNDVRVIRILHAIGLGLGMVILAALAREPQAYEIACKARGAAPAAWAVIEDYVHRHLPTIVIVLPATAPFELAVVACCSQKSANVQHSTNSRFNSHRERVICLAMTSLYERPAGCKKITTTYSHSGVRSG